MKKSSHTNILFSTVNNLLIKPLQLISKTFDNNNGKYSRYAARSSMLTES